MFDVHSFDVMLRRIEAMDEIELEKLEKLNKDCHDTSQKDELPDKLSPLNLANDDSPAANEDKKNKETKQAQDLSDVFLCGLQCVLA